GTRAILRRPSGSARLRSTRRHQRVTVPSGRCFLGAPATGGRRQRTPEARPVVPASATAQLLQSRRIPIDIGFPVVVYARIELRRTAATFEKSVHERTCRLRLTLRRLAVSPALVVAHD